MCVCMCVDAPSHILILIHIHTHTGERARSRERERRGAAGGVTGYHRNVELKNDYVKDAVRTRNEERIRPIPNLGR
jgi:hypothetical protein